VLGRLQSPSGLYVGVRRSGDGWLRLVLRELHLLPVEYCVSDDGRQRVQQQRVQQQRRLLGGSVRMHSHVRCFAGVLRHALGLECHDGLCKRRVLSSVRDCVLGPTGLRRRTNLLWRQRNLESHWNRLR
jgi:hypothetical protein